MDVAKAKMEAAFEFFSKIGAPYYCFHDTDVVGDGSVFEIEKRLSEIIPLMKDMQAQTGTKLLWGRITSYNVCYTKLLRSSTINAL